MLWNWRSWVLIGLFFGPILVYMGFGTLWLWQRNWLLLVSTISVLSGVAFGYLAARWTRSQREILPPIDWDVPLTFAKVDQDAWALVEQEAERSDEVALESLIGFDVYVDTGRNLALKLAAHYHPLSTDPIENVPVVDLLTALELAAEDLRQLCRQVPGGDLLTPSHWKKAVQVAGYIQRANDIYSYLLPIFSPMTGIARLGAQQWMVKPAWRDMQENLLRWFFRAYINRLGLHLIELNSGRLGIGAERYRRLTRRVRPSRPSDESEIPPLRIAIVGARQAGQSRLVSLLNQARNDSSGILKARLQGSGVDSEAFDRFRRSEIVEVPAYTASAGDESARDRATRREAASQAVDADLMVLVIANNPATEKADKAFAQAWDQWFMDHPAAEYPPALAVLTGIDQVGPGETWSPPYEWQTGTRPREQQVRARIEATRMLLPPSIGGIIAVGVAGEPPFGLLEDLIPALIGQFPRAERASLIRHLRKVSSRSKAQRLATQFGERGRSLWKQIRTRRSS